VGLDDQNDAVIQARLAAQVEAAWLLDAGLEAGFRLGGSALRDEPDAGRTGPCDPLAAGCPTIGGVAPVGPFSRLTNDPTAKERGLRAAVDTANLFLRTGWVEATLGRDAPISARYAPPPPTVLDSAGPFAARLRPDGGNGPRLVNDLAGRGAKLSLESPRLAGLKLAAAYTPDREGLETEDPAVKTRRNGGGEVEKIWELAANYARPFGEGAEFKLGASAASGEAKGPGFGTVEAYGVSAELAAGAWRGGIAAVASDQGLPGRRGRLEALGASVIYTRSDWSFMAAGATERDKLFAAQARSGTLAASRKMNENINISFAAQAGRRSDLEAAAGATSSQRRTRNFSAIFVEFSFGL
jgi:hypothetical protein